MLQFIRDRAQGVIAWFIVLLILVPFALWGINDYVRDGKERPVASVNGTAISKQQLQEAYQQQRQRLEQMLGANFRPEMFGEGAMKQAVLDGMVDRELVTQASHSAGLRISDATVAELIRNERAFQRDGKFSQETYEQALRRQGLTPAEFESDLRRDLISDQWRSGIQQSAFATPAEIEQYVKLQRQTRDFGYMLFPVEQFAAKVQVSEGEVQEFYDANKARFMVPEQVRVAYVELAGAQAASNVAVADADVRNYYEAHRDEFTDAESRRASHILFRVEAGAPAAAEQAAKQQADDTLKRIRAGEAFAPLAKQLSQDPGSAQKGGDLGFFARGSMVPEFDAKVFAMKKGEVSEPVRTQFGYHIIRLDEVRGGAVKSFEQVRAQIADKLRNDKAQEHFYEVAEKLSNMAYEHPDTLQPIADELKLAIKRSDYFGRSGGTGIAANPKVAQAAFSEEVLEKGNNSEPVELARDHLIVLRVEDRKPEAQRPLGEVRAQIVAQVKNEKARSAAHEAAEKALAAVKGGGDAAAVAKRSGAKWQAHKGVGRGDGKVARPVVETAFRLARPGKGPSVELATLPNGDETVVALMAVQDGAATDQPQQAQAIVRGEGEASYQGVVATLRKEGKVEINKDQL